MVEPNTNTATTAEAPPPKPAQKQSDFPFAVTVAEVYDGPLDLLLDLIRKQDIDIYDIPIAKITAQYLAYVERMRQLDVNVAADFIYMASVLIHIKSKMLLQKQQIEDAALTNPAIREFIDAEGTEPELAADVIDLVKTFQQILQRAKSRPVLEVNEETVTVSQMIEYLRRRLMMEDKPIRLKQLLRNLQSRQALVCMFLALLEMVRLQAIQLRQEALFGEILVRKHTEFDSVLGEQSAVRDDWR